MSTQLPQPDPAEDPRLAACLSALPRRQAPSELAGRVHLECSTQAPVAHMLRELPAQVPPGVLARLVREELEGEAAALKRHIAGLPRLAAPAGVRSLGLDSGRHLRAPAWAGIAAAAVLLLALGLRHLPIEQRAKDWQLASNQIQRPALRFELEPMAADQINPLVRPLVASLDQGRNRLWGGR
jgi:hypothetical protein